eukprot:2580990-Amphidinium_carterae.2
MFGLIVSNLLETEVHAVRASLGFGCASEPHVPSSSEAEEVPFFNPQPNWKSRLAEMNGLPNSSLFNGCARACVRVSACVAVSLTIKSPGRFGSASFVPDFANL